MEKKKTSIVLTIVAVATLIALVVGATFAYFQATGGQAANADVKVTTYTTDLLTFTTGDSIAIYADQSNFADGAGNQSGTTFARAHLLANNKTNTATDNYYVYLNISKNTFEYTQEDSTAELLLQVTDPNGVEVTTLSGLEYKTVTDGQGNEVKGFDVTTFEGLATIANNYEINANPEKEQTWNVSIVFVNLDADQTKNTGKTLSASLTITKEKDKSLLTMADVCTDGQTLASCVKSMHDKDSNLYLHDSTLENGANDNSYRYAGSSSTTNNYVCFGSDADTCPTDNLYRIIGVFDGRVRLIKADYANSDLLGTNGDYSSYTYPASSFSNYMGSKETINGYYWNNANYLASNTATGYYNDWSYSQLNTVNLNTNYLTNIGTEWANMIDTTTWKVGGNTYETLRDSNANTAYTNEITTPSTQVTSTYDSKVGLMYVSDYYYGASPTYWTYQGYNSSDTSKDYSTAIGENWMFLGIVEWTMARSSYSRYAFSLYSTGRVDGNHVSDNMYGARPVFHLVSSVNYVSGDGTKTSPIRIN